MKKLLQASAMAFTALAFIAPAQALNDFLPKVIKNGKLHLDARYRFESVEQDSLTDAKAHTVQTRLGWETAEYLGVSGMLGFSNVSILDHQKYNSGGGTSPDQTRKATIADPRGTVVDNAYLNINNFIDTKVKLGRQHFKLNNERFFGDEEFRQTNQTMDAIHISNESFIDTELTYAYINRVNRIWGEEATRNFAHNHNDTHVLNATYKGLKLADLTAYFFDIDNRDVNTFSSQTWGVRAAGDMPLTPIWQIVYEGEYAHQRDANNNSNSYSAHYSHLSAGLVLNKTYTFKAGREDLGGDKNTTGEAFQTPYASLHQFQGMADMFTTTPSAGVEDWYVSAEADLHFMGPVKLMATYHDFQQSDGSTDYGHEIDVKVSKDFCKHWGVSLAYAAFEGKRNMNDTKKLWFSGTFRI